MDKFWKWVERAEAADGLVSKYGVLIAVLGGSSLGSALQGLSALLSQPNPPWWFHFLISGAFAFVIVWLLTRRKWILPLLVLVAVAASVSVYLSS